MSRPTLVFDLDGTLVDTAPDLWAATNHVLAACGRRRVSLEEVRGLVGHGARKLIERGLAVTGGGLADGDMDRLFAEFLAYYRAHIADASRPYPGVVELLERANAAGLIMCVCTNKLEALSVRLLEALDLAGYFGAIVGPDTIDAAKPDPAPLYESVRRAGGDAGNVVLIGDSETDIRTGQAAGAVTIAVSFGYAPAPVADFAPDHVVDHHDQIWPLVAALTITG